MAFAALPDTVSERYFRGDSACYETDLLRWLSDEERHGEPGGRIGFAISAMMSKQLATALGAVSDPQWVTFDEEPDGTKRQCAEVDYVPSQRYEHKHSRPLRYVGLRILKPQGSLFADGSDRHHHAVVTNLDWDAAGLLQWHREKAGTVEHVHDELKNGLAAGHMPSQRFAVNAAWFEAVDPELQHRQRDSRVVPERHRAHGAVQALPAADGARGRADESQQLHDAPYGCARASRLSRASTRSGNGSNWPPRPPTHSPGHAPGSGARSPARTLHRLLAGISARPHAPASGALRGRAGYRPSRGAARLRCCIHRIHNPHFSPPHRLASCRCRHRIRSESWPQALMAPSPRLGEDLGSPSWQIRRRKSTFR